MTTPGLGILISGCPARQGPLEETGPVAGLHGSTVRSVFRDHRLEVME